MKYNKRKRNKPKKTSGQKSTSYISTHKARRSFRLGPPDKKKDGIGLKAGIT
jgi:hypothetical protein